jgi:molybdate transport system substrate-binding protein
MEEVSRVYESKKGVNIKLDCAGSGELLAKIELTHRGDLYVCHDPLGGAALKKGLVKNVLNIGYIFPVIVVPKGNPKSIKSLGDLVKPGLKVGLTDHNYSSCGHINNLMFKKAGLTKRIEKNIVMTQRTHGAVANALKIGTIDAGIVWNAVAARYPKDIDFIDIEKKYRPQEKVDAVTTATYGVIDMAKMKVTVSEIKFSNKPETASDFAEFVISEEGKRIFKKHGFFIENGR